MTIGSPLTAALRLTAYFLFTLALIPVQAVLVKLGSRGALQFPYWYHRQCCKLLAIRIERRGRQSRVHPTLYVVNHTSYVDITVLGALIRGSFVAKAEVARWPFFGWLAKLQRTVFVERKALKVKTHSDEMAKRLEKGESLILFPEGTSNDGNRVLPFKSALLSVAERRPGGEPLTVQPVSLTYTRLDGLPLGRYLRPLCSWYGDMDLGPHLWQFAGLGQVTVVVQFHKPVTIDDFESRKALTRHCEAEVAAGVARALSGRRRQPEALGPPEAEKAEPAGPEAPAGAQPS